MHYQTLEFYHYFLKQICTSISMFFYITVDTTHELARSGNKKIRMVVNEIFEYQVSGITKFWNCINVLLF